MDEPETTPDAPADDDSGLIEGITCPHCAELNAPGTDFCTECGCALSAITNFGPFERLSSTPWRQRTRSGGRISTQTALTAWVLSVPLIGGGLIGIFSALSTSPDSTRSYLHLLLAFAAFVLGVWFAVNVTQGRRSDGLDDDPADSDSSR